MEKKKIIAKKILPYTKSLKKVIIINIFFYEFSKEVACEYYYKRKL